MVSKPATREVIKAIGSAARQWTDRNGDARRAIVPAVAQRTGYSLPVVETALDRLFTPLTANAIEATVTAELGSVDVLDRFVGRPVAGRVRAVPIGRLCIVSSRTTIGVAIMPAVFALCAGCEVFVKDREDALVAAFFQTLCNEEPALRERAKAIAWTGDAGPADLSTFDAVVAFGNDETLSAIARRLPFDTRFIPFGTAAGAGYVGPIDEEAVARRVARGAAEDALLYDGEGCMSLHVLFLESGGGISPATFTELLREAISQTARIYPVSASPAAVARTALHRDEALLRPSDLRVFSDERAEYLLLVSSSNDSPPVFAPRTLNVVTVDNARSAEAYIKRYGISVEALAVDGHGEACGALAASCGVARLTHFGSMQAPPIGNPHGGRPRIAEFVRWIADET